MKQRFSGVDVEVTLPSGKVALFDEITLTPTLGTKTAKSGGAPAGWTRGEIGAEGSIKLDTEELFKLLAEADTAGSWEMMGAVDMSWYALVDGKELLVEAFGCKFDAPDFTVNKASAEKLSHTLKFEVTGRDFIHINGVPLAEYRY